MEFFNKFAVVNTKLGLFTYRLNASGSELSIGEGGDYASGSACFDDPLRGGFQVNLTGTNYRFNAKANVTVSGFSPVLRLVADGVTIEEYSNFNATSNYTIAIPGGANIVEVACGGWPASCTSLLYVDAFV